MSAPSANASATPTGDRPRLTFLALLSRALCLAVMLVIVATGLMLVQTYRAALHEAPPTTQPAPASPPTALSADVGLEDLLQPGAWSLGDSKWTVTQTDLATAEGGTQLRSLGFRGEINDKPSSLETKVLAWLKSSRPTIVEGCRVYETSGGVARIRAVTRTQGGSERLQLVQGIWRRGGTVQLLEAAPAPAIGRGDANGEHLLPLPAGVPSQARRWSTSGSLTCEMLGPTAGLQQILKAWQEAGWSEEQRPQPGASSPLRVLRNGERIVRLFSWQAGPQGRGDYLLLMAQPPKHQGAN